MLYKVHSIILDAFAKCISVGLDGFINLKKNISGKIPDNIRSLSDLCNTHVHTQHNNKSDKTNILQRNGLMLNRNIKKE